MAKANPREDTLDLDCPGCGQVLEIDIGFAGGVCRCFRCGTLMTVPANPRTEQAESLHTGSKRPESPDELSPGQRPEQPAAGGAQETAAGAPSGTTEAPETDAESVSSEEVLTTASGRTVRVRRGQIGVAHRRRRVLRGTVYVAFFAAALTLIALGVFAVGLLLQTPEDGPAVGPSQQPAGFHPRANPFLTKHFLGLELRPRAVLVIDATLPSESWLWLVKEATAHAIEAQPDQPLRLVFWSGSSVHGLPPLEEISTTQPTTGEAEASGKDVKGETQEAEEAEKDTAEGANPTAQTSAHDEGADASSFRGLDPEKVGAFLDEIQTGPRGGAGRAFVHAFAAQPQQVVIVGGADLSAAPTRSLKEQIKAHPEVRVDVLAMGDMDPPQKMAQLALQTGGVAERVPVTRLERWYRRAQRHGSSSGVEEQNGE